MPRKQPGPRTELQSFKGEGRVATESGAGTPKSPEDHEAYVREELDQDQMTHQGDYRKARTGPLGARVHGHRIGYLGATEDENVPVLPPMTGPLDLIGEDGETGEDDGFEPRDELTPG